MRVAGHGDVADYCNAHGMTIVEQYTGDLENYNGDCLVLVTDNCKDKNEYYYLKYKLMKRKITLLSTHWCDCAIADFVEYMAAQRGAKRGGRLMFGFKRENGEVVEDEVSMRIVRRIFEMRDQGKKYREIAADPDVCYPDGRDLPVGTIQTILKNRSRYEP